MIGPEPIPEEQSDLSPPMRRPPTGVGLSIAPKPEDEPREIRIGYRDRAVGPLRRAIDASLGIADRVANPIRGWLIEHW